MTEKTKTQALDALEGMRQIVAREMIIKGEYVTQEIVRSKTPNLCQGHRYCAIGSLWAGAGVRVRQNRWGDYFLRGVDDEDRVKFLRRRPGLRTAYEALNASARRYAEQHNLVAVMEREAREMDFSADVEALFEASKAEIGRPELLRIIAAAKRRVKAA